MLNLRAWFSEEGFRILGGGIDAVPFLNIKYDYREEDFYPNCKNDAHLMNQLHWVVFNDMMEKIIDFIDSLDQDIDDIVLTISSPSKIIKELNNWKGACKPGLNRGQTAIDSFALYSIEYHINQCNNYGLNCEYELISKERCQIFPMP